MIRLLARQSIGLLVGAGAMLAMVMIAPTAAARWREAPAETGAATVVAAAPATPMLHYQGSLLDPATARPKADGDYPMSFRLYEAASGGSPLWTESKNVTVSRGLFATLLGDTTALNLAVFDGRELYLGVTVGSDPEATPRQPIAFVAHAIYAANADKLGGQAAAAFAPAAHTHDGAAITAGIVAEARIDPAIARDSEIMPIVVSNGGAGSGVDADLLDGLDSSQVIAAARSPLKFVEWTESFSVSTERRYFTANHLQVTPPANGVLLIQGRMRYNCPGNVTTQSLFGAFVSTAGGAPTSATGFTPGSAVVMGHAHRLEDSVNGGDFNPHVVFFPYAVTGGTTYHIWLGANGVNATNNACSASSPRIIATFHSDGL